MPSIAILLDSRFPTATGRSFATAQAAREIDGWDVARHAREIDHNFPVAYMSGRDADDWAAKGVPNSIMLAKPFAPAQLVNAVSQLLNDATPAA
jgi:DNA-binding response OmpR family regulator